MDRWRMSATSVSASVRCALSVALETCTIALAISRRAQLAATLWTKDSRSRAVTR